MSGFSVNAIPPDPTGAVGPNHYVQMVNLELAVFTKSGGLLYGPQPINSLWSGFGGGCQSNNDGDPSVRYDPIANRWILSEMSVSTTPYLECLAVSKTGDPTGAYYRYAFSYRYLNDYPKLSVWPDAYYITYNMFNEATNPETFVSGTVCALQRSAMLAGNPASQQCFNLTNFGGLLAGDLEGPAPPAGEAESMVALGGSSQLAAWTFQVDWSNPANTTLSGPTYLATNAFTPACSSTGTCIPQAGTSQKLDGLGDRIMDRLSYRNFGDHESLVAAHSIVAGSSVGIRWYELRLPSSGFSIHQQGTWAPDGNYRWLPSAAMDQAGNLGLGYSTSGGSIHPGIHFTGRLAGDALGGMTQGDNSIIDGAGSQTGVSRWGDYSNLSVDPDGCTFWYTNEQIPSNGSFNWSTQVGSFTLPGCSSSPPPVSNDFSIGVSPASQTVTAGSSTSYTVSTATTSGSAQSVSLSVSGLPGGASASFNPSSVSSGGSSTLSVTTTAGTPAGSHTLSITGTGSSATHGTSTGLTVNAPPPPPVSGGISNGGFETGSLSGWTSTGTTSISTTAHSGSYSGMAGSTSPVSGDNILSQTFTAPSGSSQLSLWFATYCRYPYPNDGTRVTLLDNTSSTSTTVVPLTCNTNLSWTNATTPVTPGHSYTLSLISHSEGYSWNLDYARFDDITLPGSSPPPPPPPVSNDFSIGVSPASQTVTAGSSTSYTVSTATTSGSAQSVSLSVSGLPGGASASFNPSSVSSGGSSTLSVITTAGTPAGSYTLSITGTGSSASHGTSTGLTVNAPPPPPVSGGISNGGFETGSLSGWTSTGTTSISTTAHSGSYSGMAGSTSPVSGDNILSQTFTAPSGSSQLSLWFATYCRYPYPNDGTRVTLLDNTSSTSTTVVPLTCNTNLSWTNATTPVTPGHSYSLSLISHSEGYSWNLDYALFDDITLL